MPVMENAINHKCTAAGHFILLLLLVLALVFLILILILILFCCHPITTCWKKEKGRCAVRRQGPESSRLFIAFTAA